MAVRMAFWYYAGFFGKAFHICIGKIHCYGSWFYGFNLIFL